MKRQITEIEREIIERNIKQLPSVAAMTIDSPDEKLPTPRALSPDIDLHALDPLSKYQLSVVL